MVKPPRRAQVLSAPTPCESAPSQRASRTASDQSRMSSSLARRAQTTSAGASMQADAKSLIVPHSFADTHRPHGIAPAYRRPTTPSVSSPPVGGFHLTKSSPMLEAITVLPALSPAQR